jgi:NAD(P)H-dependent flavin oxidoreductase YrpB (nitropropane dioxygenase family)
MLRNDWTEAWEQPENPKPLGMPLQGMVTADAISRTSRYAGVAQTQRVAFNPVGQVVGMIKQRRAVRDVVYELVEGYVEATERLSALAARA